MRRDSGCAFSDRAGVNGAHLQERTRQRAPDALMALVHLAVEQPGRDYALSLIALHCDNRIAGGEKSGEAGAVGAVQGWMILTAALELSRNQVTHFYNLQSVLVNGFQSAAAGVDNLSIVQSNAALVATVFQ